MLAHLARELHYRVGMFLEYHNGNPPERNSIESLSEPGTVPSAIRFDYSWVEYTTGRRHDLRVTITETTSDSRP